MVDSETYMKKLKPLAVNSFYLALILWRFTLNRTFFYHEIINRYLNMIELGMG